MRPFAGLWRGEIGEEGGNNSQSLTSEDEQEEQKEQKEERAVAGRRALASFPGLGLGRPSLAPHGLEEEAIMRSEQRGRLVKGMASTVKRRKTTKRQRRAAIV